MSQLWSRVGSAVRRLPRKDSFVLKTLSTLISCGLGSRRKVIANATVELWNSTFGLQDALEYPLKVKNALRRLRPIVELQLPTFPESTESEVCPLESLAPVIVTHVSDCCNSTRIFRVSGRRRLYRTRARSIFEPYTHTDCPRRILQRRVTAATTWHILLTSEYIQKYAHTRESLPGEVCKGYAKTSITP